MHHAPDQTRTCYASYGPAQGALPPAGEPDKYDPKAFHSYFGHDPRVCAGWYEAGHHAYRDYRATKPASWMNEMATYWWRLGNEHAQIEYIRRQQSAHISLTGPE